MKRPALLLVFAMLLATASMAQQAAKPTAPPAASEQQAPAQGAKGGETAEKAAQGPTQELAEASREAAGEGDESEQFKHSPSVRFLARITGLSLQAAYWLAIAVNFVVIALAIGWLVKSNLPAMFRTRTQNIRKTLDEARAASEDADRRLAEIEARLAKLDSGIAVMRSGAEAEAAAEEARIRAAAEEDAHKVIAAAEGEIEAAARLAQRQLKAFAAELAVTLAEKRIQVDAPTDHALVQRFTRDLGARRDGEGS
jgi:F-type H+-transporting ATPase subunit b